MMYRAAVVTISDGVCAGTREDTGGPLLCELLREAGFDARQAGIVPDERPGIEALLRRLSDRERYPLILTTGGTGFSPRDVTPEATIAVCERLAPGLCEAMRAESLRVTPRAMLSRMAAGIRGVSLIVNLPGSPKAIRENLAVILPVLVHGLDILTGGAGECARE